MGIVMDRLTIDQRSRLMAKIRSVSMMEKTARSLAEERTGCRLRHQPSRLIGKPDYANKRRKVVVFVHGCYWHRPCPLKCANFPGSNAAFWRKKFKRNAERHEEVREFLEASGFTVFVVWEHEVRIAKRTKAMVEGPQNGSNRSPKDRHGSDKRPSAATTASSKRRPS